MYQRKTEILNECHCKKELRKTFNYILLEKFLMLIEPADVYYRVHAV